MFVVARQERAPVSPPQTSFLSLYATLMGGLRN